VADVLIAKADGKPNFDFKGTLSFSWPKLPLQDVLNKHHKNYDPLFKLGYGLTYKSGKTGPKNLPEQVVGVASDEPQDINLYVRRPLEPWHVFIENYERQQILSGAFAALPKGDVKVQTIDKDVQEDALAFAWKDTWRAGMTLESGEPLDLTAHMDTGVLTLDIKIDELAKGGVSFKMECQKEGCDRVVPFTMAARDLVGKGWKKIYVPLSCFKQEQDNFSATTMPFALEVGGAGEVAVANVQLLIQTPKDVTLATCPDYKTVSVTPGMLNEWWSIDWWLPRHEQKLSDAKAIKDKGGKIDLLFIGDSITQGWEKEGAAVWEKHYAQRNAFAIGFGGDRTENVLWRFQHGALENMSPKLVVMMIGTNNTGHRHENPATTAAGIKNLLNELQQRLPNAKVLLLAVFPRDAKPDGQLRQINNGVNALIKNYADNKKIFFADINSVFLTKEGVLPEEIMPDLLHPNEKGYELWAKALEPHLQKLLK
jgi:beta-glucosidase